MKTRSLLIAIAALFCASGLQAQNNSNLQYHASVSLSYAMPSWDGVKAASGEGLSFGIILKQRHYFEAEVLYLKHNWKDGSTGNLTLIPMLATYRYEIAFASDSNWYLQLGGSLGTLAEKYKKKGAQYTTDTNNLRTALGAQAMAVYKLNNTFSLNAGVRIFQTQIGINDDSGTETLFSLGARVRF